MTPWYLHCKVIIDEYGGYISVLDVWGTLFSPWFMIQSQKIQTCLLVNPIPTPIHHTYPNLFTMFHHVSPWPPSARPPTFAGPLQFQYAAELQPLVPRPRPPRPAAGPKNGGWIIKDGDFMEGQSNLIKHGKLHGKYNLIGTSTIKMKV